jgi:hypothetical protein
MQSDADGRHKENTEQDSKKSIAVGIQFEVKHVGDFTPAGGQIQ